MDHETPAPRKILHIDMDAFYASVEQREDPELQGRPVAVGGSKRGVVMAASYEARKFGVKSAMPSGLARRLCPELIFVKPHFEIYTEVSRQVREIFRTYTDLVEPVSIDEAYLDVTETKIGPPSATLIARAIKRDILETTRLTATAGVSFNKFLAKTASGMNKPDGLTVILPENAREVLDALEIGRFHGIGPKTAERLRRAGINTGADLRALSERELAAKFGKAGRYYYRMVRGIDDRSVRTHRRRKSLGAERTFLEDIGNIDELLNRLSGIAETISQRMERASLSGRTVTVKIKYYDFTISTRSRTLSHGIHTAEDLFRIGSELLRNPPPARPLRLIGLSLSNLTEESDEDDSGQLELQL